MTIFWAGRVPANHPSTFSFTMRCKFLIVASLNQAKWGVTTRGKGFSSSSCCSVRNSDEVVLPPGSTAKTSIAAPAMDRRWRASSKASSSTTPPLLRLIRTV